MTAAQWRVSRLLPRVLMTMRSRSFSFAAYGSLGDNEARVLVAELPGVVSAQAPSARFGDTLKFHTSQGEPYSGVVVNTWAEVAWVRLPLSQRKVVPTVGDIGIRHAVNLDKRSSLHIPCGVILDSDLRVLDPHTLLPTPVSHEAAWYDLLSPLQPHVSERVPINEPLWTGVRVIDSLVSLGKGQSMLVYGEQATGKTSLALDVVLARKLDAEKGAKCFIVALGGPDRVRQLFKTLKENGALAWTTIIVPSSGGADVDLFAAPFLGVSLAEQCRDAGRHALVVYDEINPHLSVYNKLCGVLDESGRVLAKHILLRNLYSGILQRSALLAPAKGSGSLTSLLLMNSDNDFPDEFMSVCDGQTYLCKALLNTPFPYWHQNPHLVVAANNANVKTNQTNQTDQGWYRPPVNIAKSLSRLGSAAQLPAMRQIMESIRGELLQRMDSAALQMAGKEGDALLEIAPKAVDDIVAQMLRYFQQPPRTPQLLSEQVICLYALANPTTRHLMARIPPEQTNSFLASFLSHLQTQYAGEYKTITEAVDGRGLLNLKHMLTLKLALAEAQYAFVKK